MSLGYAPALVPYPNASKTIPPQNKNWNSVKSAVEYVNSKAVHGAVIGSLGGVATVETAVYAAVSVAATITVQYALSSVCAVMAGTVEINQAVRATIYAILCQLI